MVRPMTLTTSPVKLKGLLSRDSRMHNPAPVDMKRVAAIILGGGQGSRLFPLTETYCKPAACVGGRYRIIDIPISNAINSGCSKIFILTQFLSISLHQHISRTYQLGTFHSGFIELLPAEQKPTHQGWFQGTADAVRQNLDYLVNTPVDYFLILSGDQLYNMDFQHLLRFAQGTDADLVIASLPVDETEAKRMGLLKVNEDRFITEFHEKPQSRELLDHMRIPDFISKQIGNNNAERERPYLGSMGIYLFKRQALFNLLQQDPREDFGKHLIPAKVKQGKVAAYFFDGYWEDIGTISSFYRANMAFTGIKPSLNCYDESNPIFSRPYHLPPPRIKNTKVTNSLICEGAVVCATEVTNSLLGPRTVVQDGTIIRNSYIIGNDFYNPPNDSGRLPEHLDIGEECIIEQTIIDRNVCLGKRVQLVNKDKMMHFNGDHVYIREGIIVVTSGAHLPDDFVL